MPLLYSDQVSLPTKYGTFKCMAIKNESDGVDHITIFKGEITNNDTLVRVHSSCITGDVLHSLKCDCGDQLEAFMQLMSKESNAMLIYLQQEGRNIGLFNKIKAYKMQEDGLNTAEANVALGFKVDQRAYDVAADILLKFKPSRINIASNNPHKISEITKLTNIPITRVPLNVKPNSFNKEYLNTKKTSMNHLIP